MIPLIFAAKGAFFAWNCLSPEEKQRLIGKVRGSLSSTTAPTQSTPKVAVPR